MTLEEAIEHCKEVAKESREAALSYARANAYETAISCKACGQEHEQLALWLTELKSRRIAAIKELERVKLPKTNADRIRQMTDEELAAFLHKLEAKVRLYGYYSAEAKLEWLKQEVSEDDGCKTD